MIVIFLLIHPHISEKGVGYFTYHKGKILECLCKEQFFFHKAESETKLNQQLSEPISLKFKHSIDLNLHS